jgi:hypothetical protein
MRTRELLNEILLKLSVHVSLNFPMFLLKNIT